MDWLLIVIWMQVNPSSHQAALAMVTEQQCKSSLAYVRAHAKSVTCIDPKGNAYVLRDVELFSSEALAK